MPPRVIKHQLTCPFELTSGSFLIGRRRILVVPRITWNTPTDDGANDKLLSDLFDTVYGRLRAALLIADLIVKYAAFT